MSWSGYIPGSLLAREREFLRPGSIRIYRSVQGYGTPPGIEDYPFQGLDIPMEGYATDEASRRSLYDKYPFQFTPLGAVVAELTRTGGDMLASSCGYCGLNVTKCLKSGCGNGHQAEGE